MRLLPMIAPHEAADMREARKRHEIAAADISCHHEAWPSRQREL